MGIRRERANDLHAGGELGIGCVDDAKRDFSARDPGERYADVWRHHQFWRDGLPRSELFQRRFGVRTGWHLGYIADGNRSVPHQLGQVWSDRDTIKVGIRWCDQHKSIS